MEKIIYEPHPVAPERKAELRAQGYKIIDAAFKPADEVSADADAEQAGTVADAKTRKAK